MMSLLQLPPPPKPTNCYLIVLQYKKHLFSSTIQSTGFKSEIKKVTINNKRVWLIECTVF